ncbi:coiled-coil domain-containing protein [Acrasis kona]|uniref:Coiled-coil domain-containing protein n=1 Tax=Acrasis kona TaxID=1008807 RepID=A0AAW2Z123_9EUKA
MNLRLYVFLALLLLVALSTICYAQDDFWDNVNVVEHETVHTVDTHTEKDAHFNSDPPIIDNKEGFEGLSNKNNKTSKFDEVESEPQQQQEAPKKETPKPKSIPPAQQSLFQFPQQEHYYYEILAVALIVIYFVNYLIGTSKNNAIAKDFAILFDEVLETQFSSVERDGIAFEKESQSLYKAWMTGRMGCDGCMVSIQTLYRHDLLMRIYDLFINPSACDMVVFDVKLDSSLAQNFILSIQPKAQHSEVSEKNYDIRKLTTSTVTTTRGHEFLPSNKTFTTDTPELVAPHLEKQQQGPMQNIYNVLKENEHLFIGLHVSDMFPDTTNAVGGRQVLQVVCKIPYNVKQLEELVKLTCEMIDVFTVGVKLPSKLIERNKRLRENYLKELERKKKEEQEETTETKVPKKKSSTLSIKNKKEKTK